MIHVGNHRHVPDVGLLVHDGPDLIHREVHLVLDWRCGRLEVTFIHLQPAEVHFIHHMHLFIDVHYQI